MRTAVQPSSATGGSVFPRRLIYKGCTYECKSDSPILSFIKALIAKADDVMHLGG